MGLMSLGFSKRAFKVRLLQIAVVGLSLGASLHAHTASLSGTIFDQAGKEFNVDPVLLYSVALVESAVVSPEKKDHIRPSPWTLRTNKPFYGASKEEAKKELLKQLKTKQSVDIGLMQINSKWHGHRVESITDLLDPLTNVRVAAQILSEHINRYPKDAVKAIGSYHTADPARGRWYASHVLRVYTAIKEREGVGHGK